jgi:AcrR family transcriptional regulator
VASRGSVAHGGSLARTHEGAPGLPRGRSRLPADTVLAAQRDRLIRAMTAAVATVGYPDVTVADVVRRARVSRTAFYAHFSDKEECFLAATAHGAELLFGATLGAVAALPRHDDDELMLRLGLRAFLRFLATEPAFARLFYVDLPAAGGRAQSRLQASYGRWGDINQTWHARARTRHPDWPSVPREAYLALAGATGELVRERVRAGHPEELPGLEDTLMAIHLAVLAGRRWPAQQVVVRLPEQALTV